MEQPLEIKYPQTILQKLDGSNESESFLSKLCNKTFLSFWSYPNIYRDQGRKTSQSDESEGHGKEICDLLVVIGDTVIIFSDKNCVMKNSGHLQLDWTRWYRKAIKESADQIFGAERWIFEHSDRVFIDRECQTKFPYSIPSREKAIIFRIIIAHGASKECKRVLGGSGSLIIDPAIIGEKHMQSKTEHCVPFAVGQINPREGFVHVFDDITLDIILKTLDTTPDFLQYLKKKEDLINRKKLFCAAGEEELLAHYLSNFDDDNAHSFKPSGASDDFSLILDEGLWSRYNISNKRALQISENEISYSWDNLIEKFIYHITSGTSYLLSHPTISEQELVLRLLIMENRTHRRFLATSIHEIIFKAGENLKASRTILPSNPDKPCYVFLIVPKSNIKTYERYRKVRGELLAIYLKLAKLKNPSFNNFIGIATENGFSDDRSEDMIYMDATSWTEEEFENARKDEKYMLENEFLGKTIMHRTTTMEYPDGKPITEVSGMKGYERNHRCPCGSGKKFKNCCGKK